jgi:hypothetical protein
MDTQANTASYLTIDSELNSKGQFWKTYSHPEKLCTPVDGAI